MTDKEKLLSHRRQIKRKKPVFRQQDTHKRLRLGASWRRPRGMHSKMRLHRKGHPGVVAHGYGSPAAVKHFSPEGKLPVLVHAVADLARVGKGAAAVIARAVGMRNRKQIVEAAAGKGITVLNIKDASAFVAAVDKKLQERQKKRKPASAAPKPVAKAEQKKGDIEAVVSEEDKKKVEKTEKDKLITKRV